MFCTICGRQSQEITILKLRKALSPDLGICVRCMERKRERQHAAWEADRQLAEHPYSWVAQPTRKPICGHCNAPMVYVGVRGERPLWCQACERERQAIAARG